MFCPKCGKELTDKVKFCWNCGFEVEAINRSVQNTQSQSDKPAPGRNASEAEPLRAEPVERNEETVEPVKADAVRLDPAKGLQPEPVEVKELQPEPVKESELQPLKISEEPQEPVSVNEHMVSAAYSDQVVDVSLQEDGYDYRNLPTEKPTGIHSIYPLDFLIRMTQKENIPTLIYLCLNVVIVGAVFTVLFALPVVWGMISGLIVYVASVIVALSPIGEFILRYQNGCRPINDVSVINRIEPLFREVYYKAKKANPMISSDVRLFINEDEAPNAFATGRKTICVTKGLLSYSDEEIKATLGHEFGHLSHKDTDRILVVSVGNTIISIIFMLIQIGIIIANIFTAIVAAFSKHGFLINIFNALVTFLSLIVLRGLMKLWTAFGVALCMKTSRGNEYQADEFSFNLGYGNALCSLLNSFGDVKSKGLFASLASSHPQSSDRINRLIELGATYNQQ